MTRSAAKAKREIRYPDSDGKPMGETGIHVNATIELFGTLKKVVFNDHRDVYVAADMFFYYEEGNPKAVKAPDIMIIRGVDHVEERRTFKLWVENRVPNVVFEVTSKKSRKDDTVVKMELYARLGVLEYYIFDPLGEYLKPRFQAYRLAGGRYETIAPEADGDYLSRELELGLRVVGTRIRLIDPEDGRIIPDYINEGLEAGQYVADRRLRLELLEERKARETAEEEIKRESKKLDAETRKVDRLEAEVRRLRALLGGRGDVPPDPAS